MGPIQCRGNIQDMQMTHSDHLRRHGGTATAFRPQGGKVRATGKGDRVTEEGRADREKRGEDRWGKTNTCPPNLHISRAFA